MDRSIKTGITIKHILIFVSLLLLLVSVNSGSVYARTTPYVEGEVCPEPCPTCHGTRIIYYIETQPTCTSIGRCMTTCATCAENGDVPEAYWDMPMLDHVYSSKVTAEPTCTSAGSRTDICENCKHTVIVTLNALGHSYTKKTEKEATCTEDGLTRYTCSRCSRTYDEKIAALGHDMEIEDKDATCTEDGFHREICKRCQETVEQLFPALGHNWTGTTEIKKPTCTEDGLQRSVCDRCGLQSDLSVPRLGHDYPQEWTVEKEPTRFAEGLRYKECRRCGDRIEESIPRKSIVPVVIIGGITVVAGALAAVLGKNMRKKLKHNRNLSKPSLESKTALLVSEDEKLIECLKSKRHLAVTVCKKEDLISSIAENEPDIVVIDQCDEQLLEGLPELVQEAEEVAAEKTEAEDPDTADKDTSENTAPAGETAETAEEEEKSGPVFGLLLDADVAARKTDLLRTYTDDGLITGYVFRGTEPNAVFTKLVLPVMKPTAGSDETLANIGTVADMCGIPLVSSVIDAYVAGRDVKAVIETAKEEEKIGVSGIATIISDISGVLGMDTLSSVTGLVGDLETIQAALDKEAGTYEAAEGVTAAKDVIDVVSDLVDK